MRGMTTGFANDTSSRSGTAEVRASLDEEDKGMNWNDVGHGMGFGMGLGWLFGILILVLVVLAIAALIKYLRN